MSVDINVDAEYDSGARMVPMHIRWGYRGHIGVILRLYWGNARDWD